MMRRTGASRNRLLVLGGGLAAVVCGWMAVNTARTAQAGEPKQDATAARERIVLFNGKEEELKKNWMRIDGRDAAWPVSDGAMVSRGGDVVTREKFTDFHLHVEFRTPKMPDNVRGQARGNSGVFLQGRYEVQVLDSYGLPEVGRGDCGAIYNQHAPLINACKPPMEWQSYDIIYRAPRYDEQGSQTEKARVTVLQNGIVIHNNVEIARPTWGLRFGELKDPGPIVLQDHGNRVEYRNIWIQPLPPQGSQRY